MDSATVRELAKRRIKLLPQLFRNRLQKAANTRQAHFNFNGRGGLRVGLSLGSLCAVEQRILVGALKTNLRFGAIDRHPTWIYFDAF